jgi:hypothetical protein
VWNNNTTFTDRLGSTPQFCNTSALHSGDNSLYSDFSAGFASGSYIGDRSIYLPASLDELQNPAVFQPLGITDHSANPSNEIYLSSFGAPLHQLQQYFFEPVNTYSTVSHAPVVHYSHPIPPVDDVPYLQNALGNFNFSPSPHLDTARPSITVQSPSVPLPSPVIFNSNQLQLSAQPTQTPLDGSQSPAQSLSSTDEIHCTWPSCNKIFPSIHTYKCVTSCPLLTLTNMLPVSTPKHTRNLSNVRSVRLDMIPSVTATDTSMSGTAIPKGIIVEFRHAGVHWPVVEKPSLGRRIAGDI